ncbi:hypothetical protein GOV12_03820 [Candidatus Pacearchaeota archaeon]|nr:hypothetical protein [Candidatus Pacearchaeota archaeon]
MKKTVLIIILVIIGIFIILPLLLGTIGYFIMDFDQTKPLSNDLPDNYVTRVIDGDTFELISKEKVRLICVDAPEKGEVGFEEAKEFLEEMILHKTIRLVKDISDKDEYGRILRYVYVNKSMGGNEVEYFLNYELFRSGHGDLYEVPPDTKLCEQIQGKVVGGLMPPRSKNF